MKRKAGKLELVGISSVCVCSHSHGHPHTLRHRTQRYVHTVYAGFAVHNNIFWFMSKSAVRISSFMCRMFYGFGVRQCVTWMFVHSHASAQDFRVHITAEWIPWIGRVSYTHSHGCQHWAHCKADQIFIWFQFVVTWKLVKLTNTKKNYCE